MNSIFKQGLYGLKENQNLKIKIMKKILLFIFFSQLTISQNQWMSKSISEEPIFETKQLFFGERMPNIVVSTDGSIIASFGKTKFMVRRSEDGGNTWGPTIKVADGIHGGGLTVDEKSGDIIAFIEQEHPPSKLITYRSRDNGKSWKFSQIKILPDKNGKIPSMHMNEHGITLLRGKYRGRLIRPTRYYNAKNSSERKLMYKSKKMWEGQFSNAIYSDDGGYNWSTSNPFPANGTGEAAIVELNNGSLYYNSRRHFYNDGNNHRMRLIASSTDGGQTWNDIYVSDELPDGPKNLDYGLMAGLDRLPYKEQDILIFSNVDSKNERENGMIWMSFDSGKTWPLKKSIDQGRFKYSSLAIGRENTPSEGFIYLLYEFGDFQNDYAGAKIAKFNLSWLFHGKDIDQYLK